MSKLFLKAAMAVQQQAIEHIKQLERALPSIQRLEFLQEMLSSHALECEARAYPNLTLVIDRNAAARVKYLLKQFDHQIVDSGQLMILAPRNLNDQFARTIYLSFYEDNL